MIQFTSKDRKNISTTQRFRRPEYWPFRVGAQEQSINNTLANAIEDWNISGPPTFNLKITEPWTNYTPPAFILKTTEGWS